MLVLYQSHVLFIPSDKINSWACQYVDLFNKMNFSIFDFTYICSFSLFLVLFLLSIWVFFYEHSRFIGQQGKGEAISLISLYHFHSLHKQLDVSQTIIAEGSPLHVTNRRTQTGILWFPS